MITALIIAAVLIICGIYIYFENNTLQSSKFDISSGACRRPLTASGLLRYPTFTTPALHGCETA